MKTNFFQKSTFFESPIAHKRFIFEHSYVSYDKRQKSCNLIVIKIKCLYLTSPIFNSSSKSTVYFFLTARKYFFFFFLKRHRPFFFVESRMDLSFLKDFVGKGCSAEQPFFCHFLDNGKSNQSSEIKEGEMHDCTSYTSRFLEGGTWPCCSCLTGFCSQQLCTYVCTALDGLQFHLKKRALLKRREKKRNVYFNQYLKPVLLHSQWCNAEVTTKPYKSTIRFSFAGKIRSDLRLFSLSLSAPTMRTSDACSRPIFLRLQGGLLNNIKPSLVLHFETLLQRASCVVVDFDI